jgi:hypothetical protein
VVRDDDGVADGRQGDAQELTLHALVFDFGACAHAEA